MKRELLIVLEEILNDNEVRKAIENNNSINYQDYMSIKDYVSNKTEQLHLIERLKWLQVNNKIYENDLENKGE